MTKGSKDKDRLKERKINNDNYINKGDGIAQSVQWIGYELDDQDSIPSIFPLRHRVQIGAEVHPVSYPMGTGWYIPVGKAAGAWSRSLTST